MAGSLEVDGLDAPVRVVRDRWGVPHIDAQNEHDLFFAQGFVQAEDRLFQMDLWRRSVQGRVSEVLGANFIERDAMTRRVQFSGEASADWAAMAPGTKAIADAFVAGVNTWVARARAQPPEAFTLAGWAPEAWRAEDLLNRTDAFLASGDAIAEVLRARIVAALGAGRASALLPGIARPAGLDASEVSYVVADALRSVGTQPFFAGLAAPVPPDRPRAGASGGSNAWTIAGSRTATGAAVLASDPHRAFSHPSPFYLVHLHAPGWDVAGAAVPWLPGVVMGHNTRIAWGFASLDADVEDLFVERTNPEHPRQVEAGERWTDLVADRAPLRVRGRAKPIEFVRETTPNGVIIASDRARHLAFALKWIGFEPGTAPMLGALAVDRAQDWREFQRALAWWKAPAVTFVYADRDGVIASHAAGLVPLRRGWTGSLPAPGWTGAFGWRGWRSLDSLPHDLNPRDGYLVDANGNEARTARIREVIRPAGAFGARASVGLQHDVHAWAADRLVPLLARVPGDDPAVEDARRRLLAWNREVTTDSAESTLFVLWEQALQESSAERTLDPSLARAFVTDGLAPIPDARTLTD